jgi:hypothetical protein
LDAHGAVVHLAKRSPAGEALSVAAAELVVVFGLITASAQGATAAVPVRVKSAKSAVHWSFRNHVIR